ncbi:MAG: SDR family NAD(P)-dependent oxidoreductase [Gammaproteobacteria bacterium]|nr:SDR family NAD(P)-dependent oxidoreductase [Gammaproteobacteria bacterium]
MTTSLPVGSALRNPTGYIDCLGGEVTMAGVNPDGLLRGKVAVVTGASRGIGEAIALRYAMEGAKVVASARTVEESDHYLPGTITHTVERINNAGGRALAVRADLAVSEDRHQLIEAALEAFGGVDILVNNAAITYFIAAADFPEKRFRLMMDVQVWAPFELTQLVLPGMRERGEGWILNVSSHAALHPDKTLTGHGGTVYGMCKAALERFTTGLAQEMFDENIGVNVISPGLVATPGVMHHKLINDTNKDRVTPVEHMAEACLRLVYGDPRKFTGRIAYADELMAEFDLTAADLI